MAESVSDQVVLQRVRNRIIEYLEWVSSYERQREYQRRAPINVANEAFNQWEDWVREGRRDTFTEPVFSTAEQVAIGKFEEALETMANAIPDSWPNLEDLIGSREWEYLRAAAQAALDVFSQRGKLSEDKEIALGSAG